MPRPVIDARIAEVLERSSYQLDFPHYKSHDDDRRRTLNEQNWSGDPEIIFLGYNPNNGYTFTILESGTVTQRTGAAELEAQLAKWLGEDTTGPGTPRLAPDKTFISRLSEKYGLVAEWWAEKTNPGWRVEGFSKSSRDHTTAEQFFHLAPPPATSSTDRSAERSLP